MGFRRALFVGLLALASAWCLPDALAWRYGVSRPTFTAPGVPCGSSLVPACDYATGRTSTNQFRKAVANGNNTLVAISSSSVAIGTGAKVFTIDTALSAFDATDKITLASRANNANSVTGTVTSLVGTTLTLDITSVGGSGTHFDWDCILHLPADAAYDGGVSGLRIGSTVAPVTITDWDFDGFNGVFFLQNTQHIDFVQTRFGLSNFTFVNAPYIGVRSGSATFSLTNVTIEGYASFAGGATFALGDRMLSCSYCWVNQWPGSDVFNGAGVAGQATVIEYSVLENASTLDGSHGLHSDTSQLGGRAGSSFSIHHTIATLPATTPPGGTDVDGIFLWTTNSIAWDATTTVNNVIFIGGGYVMNLSQTTFADNATITFGDNVYLGGWAFGPTYPLSAPFTLLAIAGFKNYQTGASIQFTLNSINYFSYP